MPGLDMHRSDSADTMLREESSEQSILAVMTRFVQAVNAMDETVMIPMRLKDLPEEESKSRTHKGNQFKTGGPDMYDYYYMLNAIKNELVSGPRSRTESECETDDLVMTLKTIPATKKQKSRRRNSKKRNSFQQSDSECSMGDSTMSSDSELASSSISDESESEDQLQMIAGSDASIDVTEDDEETLGEAANDTVLLFRHHLQGLHGILKHLTNNAHCVTNKYQEEIGDVSGSRSNMSQLPSFTL